MIFVIPKIEEENEVLDIVPYYERIKYSKFLDIFKSIYSNIINFNKDVEVTATKDYLDSKKEVEEIEKNKDNLEVKEINIENDIIEEKHYSKESLHIVTKEEQELLNYGTKVHKVLEQIDFKNPHLELFDLNKKMEEKIKSFLNSEIIKDNINGVFYKEYEFTYLEDNTHSHGIIDLLIEQPDKMIIIDYKLKNIDDENYNKQLNGYRKYIKEKTKKEVDCLLYSIQDERFRIVYE